MFEICMGKAIQGLKLSHMNFNGCFDKGMCRVPGRVLYIAIEETALWIGAYTVGGCLI